MGQPRNYFRPRVVGTQWVTPGMIRITLGGGDLHDYPSTGIGDEYVRVHFPLPDGSLPHPQILEDGAWKYAADQYPPVAPYTIRRHDPVTGEIDIDFVIHGHGSATEWARSAQAGDEIAIGLPRGLYEPPRNADRMVFVTDATGLPALGRLLEQLDPASSATCLVEVAEESHRQELVSPANLHVQWIAGRGNGIAPSAMTQMLRTIELPEDCYVWVAGESKELRSARRYLRHERGLAPSRYTVIGYWTDKHEQWLNRYLELDPDTLARLEGIWVQAPDEESGRDLYERELEELGL